MQALHRRAIAAQRLVIHRHLLRAGRDEAFRAVIVVAGAHVVVAGGDLASFRRGFVGDAGDAIRHRGPFLAPDPIEIGLRGARLEPPADAVDLVHGDRAIGRHALDDLHGVAPAQIAGKMHRPGALAVNNNFVVAHSISFAARPEKRADAFLHHGIVARQLLEHDFPARIGFVVGGDDFFDRRHVARHPLLSGWPAAVNGTNRRPSRCAAS